MERDEQALVGFSVERTQRLGGAEIWSIRTSEDWEIVGQAFVVYPEFEVCQVMLAVEADYMEESEDILDLLLDTLGVDEFVCSLAEWKEDIYSDDDGEIEDFEEEVID
jgi:hypothetical protein